MRDGVHRRCPHRGSVGLPEEVRDVGLDFAGMVAMGEYSDACICHVHGQQASGSKDSDDAAAVAGGAAGVVMQMRRAQEQSANATLH